jgi:hypothetical protein
VKVIWCSGGTYHLQLQGRRVSSAYASFTSVSDLAHPLTLKMESIYCVSQETELFNNRLVVKPCCSAACWNYCDIYFLGLIVVGNWCCCLSPWKSVSQLPFTFEPDEYAHVHFKYGFYNRNVTAAIAEHCQHFPKLQSSILKLVLQCAQNFKRVWFLPWENTEHEWNCYGRKPVYSVLYSIARIQVYVEFIWR